MIDFKSHWRSPLFRKILSLGLLWLFFDYRLIILEGTYRRNPAWLLCFLFACLLFLKRTLQMSLFNELKSTCRINPAASVDRRWRFSTMLSA